MCRNVTKNSGKIKQYGEYLMNVEEELQQELEEKLPYCAYLQMNNLSFKFKWEYFPRYPFTNFEFD